MLSDSYGHPIFQDQDILDLLYQGKMLNLDQIIAEPSVEVSSLIENANIKIKTADTIDQTLTVEEFDRLNQNSWFMPEKYQKFDLINFLHNQVCKETGFELSNLQVQDTPEYLRMAEELAAYQERDLMQLLRWLKYFVDTMRENKIVWGVGRGSSVASYVLYLLGVHKINSIKYNLDWQEFLR